MLNNTQEARQRKGFLRIFVGKCRERGSPEGAANVAGKIIWTRRPVRVSVYASRADAFTVLRSVRAHGAGFASGLQLVV